MMRLAVLLCFLCATLVIGGVGTASATTGNTPGNPVPARYRVPHKVALLYPGQYVLKSAASGVRLTKVQMEIELNQLGYLQGVASFYGYDARGFRTSWVATLYNFHLTGSKRVMIVEILGPLGTRLLGRLFLQRTKQGDLTGEIALPKTRYSIVFHRNVTL